ncbi:hypothetical protein [Brackiella oedipodis]|uniref:hypothetical protein n=1 Tax=Brackiella oedipodis TaxID=124225 RepID=UPI00048B0280|nr:hypothetical protein [Brackiella oedipodis]
MSSDLEDQLMRGEEVIYKAKFTPVAYFWRFTIGMCLFAICIAQLLISIFTADFHDLMEGWIFWVVIAVLGLFFGVRPT